MVISKESFFWESFDQLIFESCGVFLVGVSDLVFFLGRFVMTVESKLVCDV